MARKPNKKHEILEASLRMFAREGYQDTKIEDIAAEACIGKGTVYQYFESKKHLFEEMILYYMEQYREEIEALVENDTSFEMKLIEIARTNSRQVANHFDLAQKIDVRENIISNEMKLRLVEKKKEIFSVLERAIDQAQSKGEIRADVDKEVVIAAFFGAVNMFCIGRYEQSQEQKNYVDTAPVITFLMRALKA